MEVIRYARALLPMAAIALLGVPGGGRPFVAGSADPPWNPPACRATLDSRGPSAGVAWFRMDATLDAGGTLAGQRLSVGLVGGRTRQIALPPESFASGPVGGIVLVGDDDGTRSRLRAVDPAASCASTVAVESAVIRSGILDQALGAVYEHRVDRRTREDLGVWRRSTRGGTAVPVLPGLAPDTRHGPTFATDLRWASDGRLAVASCGELACRTRVVDPATGTVVATAGTGPVVGVLDSRVIAFDVCPGFPCGLLAVDPATTEIRPIAQADGPAALGGPALVFRHGGHLVVLDTHTGAGGDVAGSDDYEPVPPGSSARAGIDATGGMVSLETIGRPLEPSTARRLDPASPAIEPVEVRP